MTPSHLKLRELFGTFWKDRRHKEIPPIPLVPKDDPTTLFTGFGMQQLVPYLLGQPHPLGKKLYNIQPCFRSQDIEEVGDNRHTTFFEMMGNWSLGSYFKEDQMSWLWEFFTEELKLPKHKLFVTAFGGTREIPRDEETYEIWQKLGVPATRIFYYGPEKNWWSRAGVPEKMPAGEPGGPDSEVFYEFSHVVHNPKFGSKCHPNCDCGRYLEIGNSVFMQYKKIKDGTFSELPEKNVDFGGGLERILAAVANDPDIFRTDVFSKIIGQLEKSSGIRYTNHNHLSAFRIIADHLKAAAFIIAVGVEPGNKDRGYVLRRLIRRSVVKMSKLNIDIEKEIPSICRAVIDTYKGTYFEDKDLANLQLKIGEEAKRFEATMHKGLARLQKADSVNGRLLFDLKQNYGFPLEIALDWLEETGRQFDYTKIKKEYESEFSKHQAESRKSAVGKFKGGLADQSTQTLKYHTATHLLHQALFDVMGKDIRQEGSNITGERLRFDFSSARKPTDTDIKKVLGILNKKIGEKLPVSYKIMPKSEAYKIGAKSFFKEKYPETVKVYMVGNYSKEFCGGPHVQNTGEIGKIELYKLEKIGANMYRIYAR